MESSNNKIIELINKNRELFKTICSTHYPLSKDEIRDYWDNLIKGDAHYTVYLGDMEQYFEPNYGLCWNSNIKWDGWLTNHWAHYDPNYQEKPKDVEKRMSIGFWNPYDGVFCDGAHKVPLDINKENGVKYRVLFSDERYDDDQIEHYYSDEDLEFTRWQIRTAKEIFSKEYGELSLDTISKFLECHESAFYENVMITKKEIWDKTLSRWIDHDIIENLFG